MCMKSRILTLAGWAAVGSVLGGCGGSQFGPDARVPVEARHTIRSGEPAGQALSLPGERGFNIHLKESSQNLGAAGEAVGRSDATSKGQATAEATAARGGSARAEFKIGHRIDNLSGNGQSMTVHVAFDLEHAVEASDPPAPATMAKVNLSLVVIDSHKRPVSTSVVAQADSDESRGKAVSPQQRDITVRLEPGESYDVVLYALVEAASADDQNAAARLAIDRLRMDMTFAPLATQPAAQAGRN